MDTYGPKLHESHHRLDGQEITLTIHAFSEEVLIDAAGDSMVLVVAGDHTPKPNVRSIALSRHLPSAPMGKWLGVGKQFGKANVVSTSGTEQVDRVSFRFNGTVHEIVLSPTQPIVFIGGSDNLNCFSLMSGQQLWSLENKTNDSVAVSLDGRYVASDCRVACCKCTSSRFLVILVADFDVTSLTYWMRDFPVQVCKWLRSI